MKKRLISFLLILFLSSTAYAALEDYTTYTEVDEQDDITITDEVNITFDTMRNDADSYVYKDYGIAHFGDFEHDVKSVFTAFSGQGRVGIWAVANALNGYSDLRFDDDDGISVALQEPFGGTENYILANHADNDNDVSVDVGDTGTDYHTITRSGTTCTDAIYSDEERLTLIDTIAITCSADTYRYIYALLGSAIDTTDAGNRTGTIEDLDLNEATFTPRIINYN